MRTRLTAKVVEIETVHGDRQEIAMLVAAIRRVEEGQYELCAECGEPIGEERLLEMPTVTLCVTCASADTWRP